MALLSCYEKEDNSLCTVFTVVLIPIITVLCLILSTLLLIFVARSKIISFERKLYEFLSVVHIISSITIIIGFFIGYPAIVLFVAWSGLESYTIVTIVVSRWINLNFSSYTASKFNSVVVQYIWLLICAIFCIFSYICFFYYSIYEPKDGLWSLEQETSGNMSNVFWHIYVLLPIIAVFIFVLHMVVDRVEKLVHSWNMTLLVILIGIIFCISRIPQLVIIGYLDKQGNEDYLSNVIFWEITAKNMHFFLFFFCNSSFNMQIKRGWKSFTLQLCKPVKNTPKSSTYTKESSVAMDCSEEAICIKNQEGKTF